MELINKRTTIKAVLSRFKDRYGNTPNLRFVSGEHVKCITDKLSALDPDTCDESEISKIMGNSSWTRITCSFSGKDCEEAVSFQTSFDEEVVISKETIELAFNLINKK